MRTLRWSLMISAIWLFMSVSQNTLPADEAAKVMRRTWISTLNGNSLVEVLGEIKFRKVTDPETLWNLRFTKDGLVIATKKGGKDGPLLGVDPKTKKLVFFDEPVSSTTWQLKIAGDYEITPPHGFKAILFMKLDGEDLRLSSDKDGIPVLGGKADILNFKVEGP